MSTLANVQISPEIIALYIFCKLHDKLSAREM